MLTPTPSNEDMDQVSVLSSEAFRKNFGQAMSVTSHGSKVDLRQTLTFDDSVGIYDVTAESSISASDVCDAVAAASGDCVATCLHLLHFVASEMWHACGPLDYVQHSGMTKCYNFCMTVHRCACISAACPSVSCLSSCNELFACTWVFFLVP